MENPIGTLRVKLMILAHKCDKFLYIGPDKYIYWALKCYYFHIQYFEHVFLGAQKNRLIGTFLLGTHNQYFGRKIIFNYAFLSGGPF